MSWRRMVLVATVLLSGCSLAEPTPTTVDVPDGQVWIEWENRTEETWAVSLVPEGEGFPGYGRVEPCSAGGMGVFLEEPFSVGIGPWDPELLEPGREIADERAWREAGGRLLVVIEDGPLITGPTVTLDTWVEQRSDLPGFCP